MTAGWMRRALAGAALAALGSGAGVAAEADRVLATVNGTEITLGHVAVLREQLPPQYRQLPDEVLFRAILDQLIQQTALAQSMEGRLSRRDELALENDRRAYLAGAELRGTVSAAVTQEALLAAYEARYREAAPETEYSAAHILVATEEEAQALMQQLEDGADFAALAQEHSTDPGSGRRGGDLGWFGLGMMVKPFEDAVVALSPGQTGGPVQTQFGWHIVRLNDTRIKEAPSLDEIRGELASEIEQAAIEARIAEATAAATVVRSDEGVDPALISNPSLFDN